MMRAFPQLVLALGALLAGGLAAGAAQDATPPRALLALTKGVDELGAVGSPGGVTCFGPQAWPLVVGGDVPVAAAAELGRGRVLALGQGGYAGAGCLESDGSRRFIEAGLRWLAGGKKRPLVARLGGGRAELAEGLGLKTESDWTRADVVLVTSDRLTPGRLGALREFLAGGGGALVAVTPWGWQQLTPKLHLAGDLTLNRLLEPFGLAFDRRTAALTTASGFRVVSPAALPEMLHADRAWRALVDAEPLSDEAARLARATLEAALGALSDYEPSLMLPLRRRARAEPKDALGALLAGWLDGGAPGRELLPLDVRWGTWQLAGPFAAGSLGRPGKPLGSKLKIEAELEACGPGGTGPDLARAWPGRAGKLPWRPVEGQRSGRRLDAGELDLHALAAEALSAKAAVKAWDEGAALVLWRRLELDVPLHLSVELTGDGGLGLWVDGEEVGQQFAGAGSVRLEAQLELAPGVHQLFVKSVHVEGKWQLGLHAVEGLDQAAVERAVQGGLGWLERRQRIDGSWAGDAGYGPGYTGMVLFALARSGLAADHPVMRRGLAYLDAHPARHVYSLAAVMLARAALDPQARAFLARGVSTLASWEEPSGMWAYPVHPSGSKLPDDLSNTLFVAMALDAAAARGVPVEPETWHGLLEGTLSCLEHERGGATGKGPLGFSYRPRGDVTGSMTVAGLSCLLYAKRGLGGNLTRREAAQIDDALSRGLGWLDRNMVWDENPGQANWLYFWIYGVERLGSLLGVSELGGLDWYKSGAEHLLEVQGRDGDWSGGHPGIDTVLALLFLKRATAVTSGAGSPRDWRLLASAPRPGGRELIVQVRRPAVAGNALECWVQTLGPGPAVESVTWSTSVDSVETQRGSVTAAEDKRLGRFALRFSVQLAEPAQLVATAQLEDGSQLRSVPIELEPLYSPAELSLAAELEANLLRGAAAAASSSRGPAAPRDAIDGDCNTNWICEAADREPLWSAELPSAKSASRLVLVHRGPSPEYAALSRVTRARVTLNRRTSFEVSLVLDPMRPTFVDFGHSLEVSRVEVALLEVSGSDAATGFSEIVLLP